MNRQEPHSTYRAAWIDQVKTVLDDSARDLDAATLSRLNRARQTARAAYRPRPARGWLLPAGLASACALLLAIAVWLPHRHAADAGASATSTAATAAKAGEADAVADEASPEFYQNLEFYAWFDAQNTGGND